MATPAFLEKLEQQPGLITPLSFANPLPLIIDTVSKQACQHVVLTGVTAQKAQVALIQQIAHAFTQATALPKPLKGMDIFRFNTAGLLAADTLKAPAFERAAVIFITDNQLGLLKNHPQLLRGLLLQTKARLIICTDNLKGLAEFAPHFRVIPLNEPSEADEKIILRAAKAGLESFHHVTIGDETIAAALYLAKRYLPNHQVLDHAFELLDMGAARSNAAQQLVVAPQTLTTVISDWTGIPAAHISSNRFKTVDIERSLTEKIYGQDAALNSLALAIQQTRILLRERHCPLGSFLLVGPPGVGKTTTAYALAEYLFATERALIHVNMGSDFPAGLLAAVQQTPYAVVLFENISADVEKLVEFLTPIFRHGFALDAAGRKIDFRQTIIILTMDLATSQMVEVIPAQHKQRHTTDLLALVSNKLADIHRNEPRKAASAQNICDDIKPLLAAQLSENFLNQLTLIPFLALDYAAVEKIILQKIAALVTLLNNTYGIELSCTPEVINFLTHEILAAAGDIQQINLQLDRYLYPTVTQRILQSLEDGRKHKHLVIQMNDTRRHLLCEVL